MEHIWSHIQIRGTDSGGGTPHFSKFRLFKGIIRWTSALLKFKIKKLCMGALLCRGVGIVERPIIGYWKALF